mmetsp:Transcript_25267/g.58664  ORF Transcript_25267/g.58664 Transcript_25267/m.58664 type:complete len:711 (-) Transcript_25267:34-2166(-)
MRIIDASSRDGFEPRSSPTHTKVLTDSLLRQDTIMLQLRRQHTLAKEAASAQESLATQLMSEQLEMQRKLRELQNVIDAIPSHAPHLPSQVSPAWMEADDPRRGSFDKTSLTAASTTGELQQKPSSGSSPSPGKLGDGRRPARFNDSGVPAVSPYSEIHDQEQATSPDVSPRSSIASPENGSPKPKLYRQFSELERGQRERLRQVRLTRNQNFLDADDESGSVGPSCRSIFVTKLRAIVLSAVFDYVAGALLMANCIMIGVQVQYKAVNSTTEDPQIFTFIDWMFSAWFVLELCLRVFALGLRGFFFSKEWNWNWFDFVIVAITVIETGATMIISDEEGSGLENVTVVRLIRVIRIARVLRVIRVMRFFRALRILVTAISGTIKSFIWTVLLLSMINYLFGVAFTQASVDFLVDLRQNAREEEYWSSGLDPHYGDLFKSILTLFEASTGGIDWKQALDPLQKLNNSWLFVTLFLIFIFFVYLAVLNVVTGLFCQTAIEMAQSDHQDLVHHFILEKQRFVKSLASLFREWDTSKDGEITLTEFEDHLNDEKMRAFLRALEIDIEDSWTLFKLLDKDKGGSVNLDEFVDGCLRLKGPAKSMQVHQIMYENRFMSDRFVTFMQACEESFRELREDGTRLEERVDGQMLALQDVVKNLRGDIASNTSQTQQTPEAPAIRPRFLSQASPYATLRGVAAWGDWNTIRPKPPLGIEV